MTIEKPSSKKPALRFDSDPEDFALVLSGIDKIILNKPILALLIDESSTGCQIALVKRVAPIVGTFLQVKIGQMAPTWTEVRWVKDIGVKVTTVGLQYISCPLDL